MQESIGVDICAAIACVIMWTTQLTLVLYNSAKKHDIISLVISLIIHFSKTCFPLFKQSLNSYLFQPTDVLVIQNESYQTSLSYIY